MGTGSYASLGRFADGPFGLFVSVSPIDAFQRLVMAAFDAILHNNVVVLCQLGQVVELSLVDAVGTGTNN